MKAFLQEYAGRVVVLLTPVFAGLSGWLCTLAAQHLPGAPVLDEAQLTAIFVAGAVAAVGAAVKWLSGLQAHEARVELETGSGHELLRVEAQRHANRKGHGPQQ